MATDVPSMMRIAAFALADEVAMEVIVTHICRTTLVPSWSHYHARRPSWWIDLGMQELSISYSNTSQNSKLEGAKGAE